MSIHPKHLRDLVIKPVLKYFDWESESLETLLLGTSAQETHLGTYLKQGYKSLSDGRGVARGIYGMEPNTYNDIFDHFIKFRPSLLNSIASFCSFSMIPSADELITNLKLATIMARIQYLRIPDKLPIGNNLHSFGIYWDMYYNRNTTTGHANDFVANYNKFILQI
jgi:hypothetical protein